MRRSVVRWRLCSLVMKGYVNTTCCSDVSQVQDEIDSYEPFALHRFVIYGDMYDEVQKPAVKEESVGSPLHKIPRTFSQASVSSVGSSSSTKAKSQRKASAQQRKQLENQPLDPITGFAVRDICLKLRLLGATISPTLGSGLQPTQLSHNTESPF